MTVYTWFLALNLMDVVITLIGLSMGAVEVGVIGRYGIGYGLGMKAVVLVLFTALRNWKPALDAMRIANWILVLLLAWNMMIVFSL